MVIAAVCSLATLLVIVIALFLRSKLHRLYEFVLIAAIKYQVNRWVLLALLVVKLIIEKLAFRQSTRQTDVLQQVIQIECATVHRSVVDIGQRDCDGKWGVDLQ